MKNIPLLALTFFLATACTTVSHAPQQDEKITVIKCGRLITGIDDNVFTTVDVLSVNGRIRQIGQGLEIPKGATVIDLSHDTVLPGLIDMHTHITALPDDSADLEGLSRMSMDDIVERGQRNAKVLLDEGFTSVRDVGTYFAWSNQTVRDEINRGKLPGPRLQAAPFYLTIPHGGGDLWLPHSSRKLPEYLSLGVARGAEQFRARAKKAVDGGADILKVIASGAVLANASVPGKAEMTRKEIEAVVQVAHQAGLKVAAHAHGTQSIKDAILAGVDTIEHASLIDDEGIRLAKNHGVALSMDVYNGDYIDHEGKKHHWPKEFLDKNLQITDVQRRNFAKAYKAGAIMIYGTDVGVFPFEDSAKQFHTMVALGMKPMDAIRSATSVAARYMGWEKDVGAIQVGRYADFIAVQGDPLADITELERVKVVIKGGQKITIKGTSSY